MKTASLEAATAAAGGPINAVGTAWMLHPEQFEASAEAGYPHPFAGYFAGRAGVLGEVDSHIVDATFFIFAPDVVKAMWEDGRQVHGAKGGSELYFSQAAEWACRHLADVVGLDRFVFLGEKVIERAPTSGLALFAGWKALPRVKDTTGRAMQVLLVLRELRGGIHLAAVTAAGLSPQESHVLNNGEDYCAFFGWPAPFPKVTHLKDTAAEIERATNSRMTAIVGSALTSKEAQELSKLAQGIQARVCP